MRGIDVHSSYFHAKVQAAGGGESEAAHPEEEGASQEPGSFLSYFFDCVCAGISAVPVHSLWVYGVPSTVHVHVALPFLALAACCHHAQCDTRGGVVHPSSVTCHAFPCALS
jgi:hypothetical protein